MACNQPLIIGIDPGTRITGYGIIKVTGKHLYEPVDFGCIRPPSKNLLSRRYQIIFEAVTTLMVRYRPIALAIETQYIDKNVQSGIKLGMARGVAMLAASLQEIPVFEYAPTKAKLAVTGQGRASKFQVQTMVKVLLKLPKIPEPEDAADALALAICHGHAFQNKTDHKFQA